MNLKVIGAGFGRTGTLSLKFALEELGLGPCYHMAEVNKHADHAAVWLSLARGEILDCRPILQGYASVTDWPTTYFWKELAAANPDAKIILSERDPEAWYNSIYKTIFGRMLFSRRMKERRRADSDGETLDATRRLRTEMIDCIVVERTFGGSLEKHHAIEVFNAHNENVRRTVPAERLLVHNASQGWEPLCAFLGVPVPVTPYPKVNATDEFLVRFPAR